MHEGLMKKDPEPIAFAPVLTAKAKADPVSFHAAAIPFRQSDTPAPNARLT